MKRRWFTGLLVFLLAGGWLMAEEAAPTADAASTDPAPAASSDAGSLAPLFGLGLDIGYASLPNADGSAVIGWQKLALNPDLGTGDFGVGLSIDVHYRFNGGDDGTSFEIRPEDWLPDNDRSILDVVLSKIRYLRYGQKGKPLYLQLGGIDKSSLGNGFLVGGYRNTLFEPEWRQLGLIADVDGKLFDFPFIGVESMFANTARWDMGGFRVFIRPMAGLDVPILQELQIGYSMAFDSNPHAFNETESIRSNPAQDQVTMWGVDMKIPLVSSAVFSMVLFGDIAGQNDTLGGQVGVGGQIVSIFDYALAVRMLQDDFIPSYFDQSYDVLRESKYNVYSDVAGFDMPGRSSWFFRLGLNVLKELFTFGVSMDGPFDNLGGLNYPNLEARLVMKEGVVPDMMAEAWYQKRAITRIEDIVDPVQAIIGAKIGYRFGPAIVSLVYDVRYDPNLAAASDPSPWVVSSKIETSISILEGAPK